MVVHPNKVNPKSSFNPISKNNSSTWNKKVPRNPLMPPPPIRAVVSAHNNSISLNPSISKLLHKLVSLKISYLTYKKLKIITIMLLWNLVLIKQLEFYKRNKEQLIIIITIVVVGKILYREIKIKLNSYQLGLNRESRVKIILRLFKCFNNNLHLIILSNFKCTYMEIITAMILNPRVVRYLKLE